MAFIGIVAIAKNFAIGKDGKLPWHHSADLKFFKQTTLGNTVVMGSNTWRSIGKPLPGRLNVVITRGSDIAEEENVKVLSTVDQAAELAGELQAPRSEAASALGGARCGAAQRAAAATAGPLQQDHAP